MSDLKDMVPYPSGAHGFLKDPFILVDHPYMTYTSEDFSSALTMSNTLLVVIYQNMKLHAQYLKSHVITANDNKVLKYIM